MAAKLPPHLDESIFTHLYSEKYTYEGGISLEGQAVDSTSPPKPHPRQIFVAKTVATGTMVEVICPSGDSDAIDPYEHVSGKWPPVCIVHGNADDFIPIGLSRLFEEKLKSLGGKVTFFEVEGEPHTFVGKMVKGSKTWETQRKGFDFLEEVLSGSY